MTVKFQEEGIKGMDDLDMVYNYFLNQLTDNLKRPVGHVIVGGAMVATPDSKFGAKLQIILEAALNLMKLYMTVEISITNTQSSRTSIRRGKSWL